MLLQALQSEVPESTHIHGITEVLGTPSPPLYRWIYVSQPLTHFSFFVAAEYNLRQAVSAKLKGCKYIYDLFIVKKSYINVIDYIAIKKS